MSVVDQLLQDVRFGTRNILRSPGFAASAVISLAFGIGATTAIFSVIYGVILHPFPYAHPETLVSFRVNEPAQSFYFYPSTPDQYLDVTEHNRVFSDVIASTISDVFWTANGEPQRLRGNFVTVNTFDVMGVRPFLGRAIRPSDGKPEAEPAAVLGYQFWMHQFGGDPKILGRHMRLNDKVRTVVGVMPQRFMWRGADVYLPIVFERGKTVEGVRQAFFLGRLKPGVTEAQVQTDLHPILDDMMKRRPGRHVPVFRVEVANFYDTFPSGIRNSLWILFGAVSLLLLIACTNVSSLLLARAAARSREIAIRGSLGAGRMRIIRQLLTESALIGIAGALAGILLAYVGLHAILAIVPPDTIPAESEITLNVQVLLFTLALSLLCSFLFGLAPALHAARSNFADTLKSAGRGVSGGFGEGRIRGIFVVIEIALAMILLVGASLVVRTLLQLEQFHTGTHPERILTMVIPLPDQRYPTTESRNTFFGKLLTRTRAIPGIEDVSVNTFVHPFSNFGSDVSVPGSPISDKRGAVVSQISSGYPRMLGLPLQLGRLFTPDDVQAARHVALVNAKFAQVYFPKETAVGRTIELSELHQSPQSPANNSFSIIGVVGDIRNYGLREDLMPEVYIPFTTTGFQGSDVVLLATSTLPVNTLINPIKAQLRAIDPDQPVMDVRTMQAMMDAWGFAEPRFSVFLFSAFASLGLLLASLGIYAVINYSVVRQTQEIGVRMALGAQPTMILRMVLGSGARLLSIGTVIGVGLSLSSARLLRSMIWGVSPFDPLSFLAVIAVLVVVGLLACAVPALRASRIDPMVALRYE